MISPKNDFEVLLLNGLLNSNFDVKCIFFIWLSKFHYIDYNFILIVICDFESIYFKYSMKKQIIKFLS